MKVLAIMHHIRQ